MKKLSFILLILLLLISASSCEKSKYNPTSAPSVMERESNTDVCVPTVKEPLPADTSLSFIACGDNLMYTGNLRDAKKCAIEGGRKYNFAPIYENVRSVIESADIAFINQEVSLAGESFGYSPYPRFNSPQDLAYDVIEAGFDVVNIANNHMIDMGASGLESTINFWNSLPVTLLGGHLDKEDFNNIRIYEKNDLKIALLAYTSFTNTALGGNTSIYIPYVDEDIIKNQVEKAKEIADLVFVSVHWGAEYRMTPNTNQEQLATFMAELGVDVIIGHHPHVIQPVKWLEGDDGHKTLCVYSLGNFVAEMDDDYKLVGGMISFDIVRKDGVVTIENPIMIPTMYYYDKSFYKNSVYLLEDFTEDMAKSIGLSYYGSYTSLPSLYKYVTDTIDPEFLPDWIKSKS